MKTTKTDLITLVAEKAGLTKQDTRKVIDALPQVINESLKEVGDTVQYTGFITLEKYLRSARMGHHPQTMEPLEIPAAEKVRVRLSKTF